jgi:hypothetical protein
MGSDPEQLAATLTSWQPIMSRFTAVNEMLACAILAAQVGYIVQ